MNDKIIVLITSVLKPVDDVRSCLKIGQSLAQTNKYEVNIIGFDSKKGAHHKNIFLHPVFSFKRNSIKRLFAPFTILKKALKLKPHLIIVNTPELLSVMIIIRILFGTKIIYDVQENYRLNIQYNQVDSRLLKEIAKGYIRLVEKVSKHFLDGYFLAEESYQAQLEFTHSKPIIKLLNKTILSPYSYKKRTTPKKDSYSKFVYSGTIGKEYGTLEAVEFCKCLYKNDKTITLIIVGYSADYKYLKKVNEKIQNKEWIRLIGGDKPVPQSEIIATIEHSDIAIMPYELNPNLSSRFPTKIYDYLALQIPMIIPLEAPWEDFLAEYPAAISTNFRDPNLARLKEDLNATSFYKNLPDHHIEWKNQEHQLIKFIENILSK